MTNMCLHVVSAGWDQFDLDFFVSAPKTAAMDNSHHKMVVFDTRQVPGDTAAFPAVSYSYSQQDNVQNFRNSVVQPCLCAYLCAFSLSIWLFQFFSQKLQHRCQRHTLVEDYGRENWQPKVLGIILV